MCHTGKHSRCTHALSQAAVTDNTGRLKYTVRDWFSFFLQKVKATLQNLSDPNEPFLLCFMMMEKLRPFCSCLQEVYTFFYK